MNIVLTRLTAAIFALCLLPQLHAQSTCSLKGDDPLKPIGPIVFTSREGTATLIGISEYSNPTVPPKKYRQQTLSGVHTYINNCHLTPNPPIFATGSGGISYNANTGAVTNTQNFHFYDSGSGFQSNSSVGGTNWPNMGALHHIYTVAETTTYYVIGNEECMGDHFRATGTVQFTLSDEDTESDAEKRAVTTAGSSNTAFRASRGATFSWQFRQVHYKAVFKIDCPGEYDVHLKFSKKPRGSSGPITKETVIKRQTLESGERIVEGDVKVLKAGIDYTLDGIELHAPCEVQPPAHSEIEIGSVKVGLSLGRGAAGAAAGNVRLDATAITAAIYTPAALTAAIAEDGSTEVVLDAGGALRQLKAPQTLADIVTLGGSSYEVRFYSIQDVGAQDGGTKIYAVNGTPYVIYKFENPDDAQSLNVRLLITETRGALVRVSEYAYAAGTNTWSLSRGNGLLKETLSKTVAGSDTTKTSTIRNGDDTVVSKTTKIYRTFAWGEELITEVLDPDGAALTTSYVFYNNVSTDGPNYGRLKLRTNADGSWERHTYDSSKRTLKTVRPYLGSNSADADNLCRVTENIYTTLADGDGDGVVEQLTTVIETTLGTETGRRCKVEWSKPVSLAGASFSRQADIRCTAAGAAWNSSDNLITETLLYTVDPFIGRSRRVLHPDGTAVFTSYVVDAGGQMTTTIKSGAANAAIDDISSGTTTITTTSAYGQVTSASVMDVASGLMLNVWAATQFDDLGRPTRMDHSDGSYETRTFSCCGLAASRDRQGVTTSFQYDDLGRQTHVTSHGLTVRTAYDAESRVKSVTRIGTDTSEIVQSSNTYDLAGRMIEQKDARDRLTTYGEVLAPATGQTTRTTTNPDGGTVVEVTARDGSRLSIAGTASALRSYEHGVDTDGVFTKEIWLGESGETTEWVKSYSDFAGRSSKRVYADGAVETSHYNAVGQLVRQVDADGICTLYGYNAKGEQEVVAVDINANSVIDFNGTDRITRTTTEVGTRDTLTVQRSTTEVWETETQNTPTVVSVAESTVDGLRSWQTVRGLLSTSVTTLDGTGGRTVVTTAPDNTVTTQAFASGRLQSVSTTKASLGTLSSTAYAYDPHGRIYTQTDARNGATTYTWFNDDQLHTVTTPDPDPTQSGPGYDPQVTSFGYDTAGRQSTVTHPDAAIVSTEYYPTGLVKKVSGARTYPVEYTYYPQGRLKTLKTWQNYDGGTDQATTTWNYDPERGWLTAKLYADNTGPTYAYKPSGRLYARTWARGITTTYSYNAAGDLEGVDYSDATQDVTLTYDRLGRPKTRTDAAGTCTWNYHANGQLDTESYSGGAFDGLGLDREFDNSHRLTALAGPSSYSVGYSYDAASRLDTVTSGSNTAHYAYVPQSTLVDKVTFKQNGTERFATTRVHDYLNRLAGVSNSHLPVTSTYAYAYSSANQRTRLTREDSAYWDYGYDSLGQLTSANKKISGGITVPGFEHAWSFDDIGNRKTSTINGQSSTYSSDLLNQYDSRTVPGVIEVLGAAQADATITVRSPAASGPIYSTTRQGDLFFRQVPVNNAGASLLTDVKITGVKNNVGPNGEDAVSEETRTLLIAGTPEAFSHDLDGNLTNDAKWTYSWDGENRLVGLETSVAAVSAGLAKIKLEFAYDGQGRRVSKKVSNWSNNAWVLEKHTRFFYDGWNLIAELNALDSNSSVRTYVWGLDLSGSMQGAGGVGGLLFANVQGPNSATYASAYDGNGNVIAYVDMISGAKSATFEYGAFGETLIVEGIVAEAMPYRFSTKFTDNETGLLYYGLRYYSPGTGRWVSRDPIEETGGTGLYGFVGNNGVSAIDILGREAAVDVWFLTVIEGGKSAGPTIAGAGTGTVATVAVVSAALVVTPMDKIIGPPPVLPYDPLDVRPPGPRANPEFRDPNSPRPYLPNVQPIPNSIPIPSPSPSIYFTPFGPDERTRCAPCIAIIGETFRPRVLAAKAIYPTAETFEPPEGVKVASVIGTDNVAWIMGVMQRNCTIIDIGYDTDRGGPGQRSRGIFYPLELYGTAGYPRKIFQQFPSSSYYDRKSSR